MTPRRPLHEDPDALDRLLGQARGLILGLIAEASRLLGGARTKEALNAALRTAILPAEAALRRAILLIARTLSAPSRPAARTPPSHPAIPSADARAPRRPSFRMREARPRAGAAAPAPKPGSAATPYDPARTAARLARRLEALDAAAANPVREARRWLRRTLKAAATRKPLPIPRFDHIPGLTALPQESRPLLTTLNAEARNLFTLPDTS